MNIHALELVDLLFILVFYAYIKIVKDKERCFFPNQCFFFYVKTKGEKKPFCIASETYI
jgi:hypothetical protein